jgi:DNA-binding transcriptional LysR family regulator
MQLRYLKTFMSVAASLSFTRAAEQIHRAQSSVTEQIQALESELGTALFDRSGRKLKLTPAGRRLMDYAGELLALADEARSAVADAADVIAGQLIVGGLETLCATRLLAPIATFRSLHPDTEILLKSANSGALRSSLKAGQLDVGFVFGRAADEPELRSEQVMLEPLVVIAPPNHRLARRETVNARDLADERFLVTETGCVYRQMFEDVFAASRPAGPQIVGEFASVAAIRGLVEAGLGCALVPRLIVAESIDSGRVAALPWIEKNPVTPIMMIWRRQRVQSPLLRRFLATARDTLRSPTPIVELHRHDLPSPS